MAGMNMAGVIVADKPTSQRLRSSARQLAQEFLLIHAVLEGFSPVDEYDWHFIIKLPAQITVAVYIYFSPRESASARELAEALLHQLAKLTSLARVNHHLAGFWHAGIVALPGSPIPVRNCQETQKLQPNNLVLPD